MNFNYTKKKIIIGISTWSGLGFIRGVQSYAYKNEKEKLIYSNAIIYGIFGFLIYLNPILLPITIHKEIYRLEINIRNIENEKKNRYYKDIL